MRLIDGLTVREPDGLAMSSRNRYLNSAERKQALCLSRALNTGEDLLRQGERRREVVEAAMAAILAEADRADYAVVRQVPDLETPTDLAGMTLLAVAGKVGTGTSD